ncbi:MAG TPA: hypothetical protein VER35_01655 [Candidatus Limnocylindrales bacterium]|nr:hypothetical protein [Candidatus Limnocylindrales bacterium]
MSLDLTLETVPCESCGHYIKIAEFNITYNLSAMWHAVCPEDDRMVQIERMTGAQASPKIRAALIALTECSEENIKLEPDNGWGTYIGFLDVLMRVLRASEENPSGIWRADR